MSYSSYTFDLYSYKKRNVNDNLTTVVPDIFCQLYNYRVRLLISSYTPKLHALYWFVFECTVLSYLLIV